MRSNRLTAACLSLLIFPVCDALAQAPPPQNERMTIPEAQQPQQPGQQQRPPQTRAQSSQTPGAAPADQAHKAPPPEEKTSVTHHSAHIAGQTITYTATAATYVIKADDGTPKATFFFVAYTKDNVPDVARRPLSFVYNGGPGSGVSVHSHGPGSAPRGPDPGWPRYAGALPDRGQRGLLPGRHRHGLRRRRFHRLQPSCTRRRIHRNSTASSKTPTSSRTSSINTSPGTTVGPRRNF